MVFWSAQGAHNNVCLTYACERVFNAPINVLPHLPPHWQKVGIWSCLTDKHAPDQGDLINIMDNRGEICSPMMGAFDPSIRSRGQAIDFIEVKSPTLVSGVVPGAIHLDHGMELLMNFTIYDFTPCPITLIVQLGNVVICRAHWWGVTSLAEPD